MRAKFIKTPFYFIIVLQIKLHFLLLIMFAWLNCKINNLSKILYNKSERLLNSVWHQNLHFRFQKKIVLPHLVPKKVERWKKKNCQKEGDNQNSMNEAEGKIPNVFLFFSSVLLLLNFIYLFILSDEQRLHSFEMSRACFIFVLY